MDVDIIIKKWSEIILWSTILYIYYKNILEIYLKFAKKDVKCASVDTNVAEEN